MSNLTKTIMNIKKEELPFSLLMFFYFFLVITIFWILKPIKKGLFISYYDKLDGFNLLSWHMKGSEAELLAKVLNMVVAFLAVIVFTWLARKFKRQQLTYIFSGFSLGCAALFSFLINNPHELTVWAFYLFGDLFNTLMVATFFAFLNDSVNSDEAKRLYGLIVLGGVTGGVFGTQFVNLWIEQTSDSAWMWICFNLTIIIFVIAYFAGRIIDHKQKVKISSIKSDASVKIKKSSVALEGAKLVFKSRYLLAIVGIVGFYEIISTVMDFQFSATIEHFLDGDAIRKQFATVYSITNIVAMIVQLFLTSFIMTRFGLTLALLILPVAILSGSISFLAFPILWIGSLLNTADNSFSYSINQSAKEALYIPTSRDEKYKAKAFIDMFVQRFAKTIAVVVSLVINNIFTEFSGIRWLSIFTVGIVIIWIFIVRYAGQKFNELTK